MVAAEVVDRQPGGVVGGLDVLAVWVGDLGLAEDVAVLIRDGNLPRGRLDERHSPQIALCQLFVSARCGFPFLPCSSFECVVDSTNGRFQRFFKSIHMVSDMIETNLQVDKRRENAVEVAWMAIDQLAKEFFDAKAFIAGLCEMESNPAAFVCIRYGG